MSNSNTLKLYRASAGSGKTYTLSLEFLKLLVRKPDSYKNILAVTFTNKATAEMQTRIMSDLYTIINNLDASLLANLMKGLEADRLPKDPLLSEDDVRKNARLALNKILHDYSRFQISTIDSFFQIILRNLAHELGVGAYLNISIDQDEPLTDAVDVLTEECNTNKDIRQKLIDFIKEKSDNSKNTNITSDIKKFSLNIFKEGFKQFEEAIEKVLKANPKAIEDYRKQIYSIVTTQKREIDSYIEKLDQCMKSHNITVDDLSSKKKGVYSYINHIKKGDYVTPVSGNGYKGTLEPDEEKRITAWVAGYKAGKKLPKETLDLVKVVKDELIPLAIEIATKQSKYSEDIASCELILEKVNEFGLLYEMSEIVRKVNNERGQFILSDTANLLQGMIQDSDTPFIYEKIGTKLDHIMIDEFQDTSQTQWNNFRPLINECLASNQTNLIVGDAKQAIYRFRNSDWQIIQDLDNEPSFKQIGVSPTLIPASGNYRSMQEIIDFNNMLFAPKDAENENDISPILQPYINVYCSGKDATASSKELFEKLIDVYRTAHQNLGKKDEQERKGFVSVEFLGDGIDKKNLSKADEEEQKNEVREEESGPNKDNRMLNHLLKTVIDLQLNKDIQAKDITILVRNSKRISQIAEFFANYKNLHSSELFSNLKLDIISDEAYLLESSIALTTLIDAMRVILNPDDLISMTEVYFRYNSIKEEKSELPDAISQTIADTWFMYSEDFKRLKGEILECSSLPLYEMTERLIYLLQLEKMKNQSSFIFKFLDALNEFIQRKTSDLAHFIDYWDKYLKQQKIPMGDNADGIRISTIHKSKGLEYHTVIIPFCNDPYTNGNSEEIAWCKIPEENKSFNGFPVWPINMKSSKAKNSIFKEDWSRNQVLTLADSINLLYVAFTRAVCNLFIMCDNVVPKKGKQADEENKVPKQFNTLLLNVLGDKLSDVEDEETTENEEQKVVFRYYQKGTIMPSFTTKEKKKSSNPFKADVDTIDCHFHYERLRANFRNSNKASDYIKNLLDAENIDENCTEEINKTRVKAQKKGILLHALFSIINTENDIEKATEELLNSGMIESKEEKDELMDYAKEKIKEHNEWFLLGLKTFNECSILSLDPNTKKLSEHRPDRVIQDGKKMIIIDYKTGKHHAEHQKQVDQYATLLQQMGYETETHLWYLN